MPSFSLTAERHVPSVMCMLSLLHRYTNLLLEPHLNYDACMPCKTPFPSASKRGQSQQSSSEAGLLCTCNRCFWSVLHCNITPWTFCILMLHSQACFCDILQCFSLSTSSRVGEYCCCNFCGTGIHQFSATTQTTTLRHGASWPSPVVSVADLLCGCSGGCRMTWSCCIVV